MSDWLTSLCAVFASGQQNTSETVKFIVGDEIEKKYKGKSKMAKLCMYDIEYLDKTKNEKNKHVYGFSSEKEAEKYAEENQITQYSIKEYTE